MTARSSLWKLSMKARYSLEDIPYESYSNYYDKIVDIIRTNELKQNNGNDLYHINRTNKQNE